MTARSGRDGGAVLCGLIGRGIQLSRTPRMHEAEGARLGLRHQYRLLDFDAPGFAGASLAEAVRAAELCGFAGVNVTYPFKIEVLSLADELSEDARRAGSANTLLFQAGRRIAYNTDLYGFAEGFRQGLPEAPREGVLLLGAGGAGVAVGLALCDLGVGRLAIYDQDAGRAGALAAKIEALSGPGRAWAAPSPAAAGPVDGVVNATPVGMAKLPGLPIPPEMVRPEMWVADIVYFPLETELLALARARGCRVLSGEGMAIHQAARAFGLFTGRAADAARMRETFRSFGETGGPQS